MTFSKKIVLAAGLTVALVLSGCGGGSNSPSTPAVGTGTGTGTGSGSGSGSGSGTGTGNGTSVSATSVPDSAGNSVATFLAFLVAMASSETSEPLSMSNGFTVPSDETSDPIPTT